MARMETPMLGISTAQHRIRSSIRRKKPLRMRDIKGKGKGRKEEGTDGEETGSHTPLFDLEHPQGKAQSIGLSFEEWKTNQYLADKTAVSYCLPEVRDFYGEEEHTWTQMMRRATKHQQRLPTRLREKPIP